MLEIWQVSLVLQERILWQLDRQYGSLTLSLVLLYIRAEEGTSAAIEDQDEDATTETVSKCGAEF